MESPAVQPLPKKGDRRIRDAASARSLWTKLRTASLPRREKWSQVMNQLDGAPPFAMQELIDLGQGWRCNINFRDASSTLDQVLVSYWRLLHDTTSLASVSYTTPDDPNSEKWEQIFQQNFNRFFDDWGPDYVRNYLLFSLNHVALGVGVAHWNDKYTARWEAVRVGEIEVPTRAKASVDKLSFVGIRQEMEIDDLWKLIRDDAAKSAAQAAGWNINELERTVAVTLLRDDNNVATPILGQDVLEMQRLMRNDALGLTTGRDPLKVIHLFCKDYDGKITRQIFVEGMDSNVEFLFDDSGADKRPDVMSNLIGAIFFDAGNGDWWGTKGFGVKNFQLATVTNRLKSRSVDRTLLDGLNFIDESEGGREVVPITNIGPFNILPKGLTQIPQYPTGRTIIETIEMLDSQSANNNARYKDQGRQIANTDTATQANILNNLQSQVDVANATLYLKQVARNLFTEQFRRLRMKGNPDADAKTFKKRCVDEMGMDEKVFHEGEISVITGADPGAANIAVQGQKALEAMQLPDANRRYWQEKYIAATFGAQAVKKGLRPVDASTDIIAQRDAIVENDVMGNGHAVPVDPQDLHSVHCEVHLQPLEMIVHNFDATGKVDPNALIALQVVLPHLEQHFNYLKADKLQKDVFQQLWPRFTAVRSSAEGLFRMVEKMHNDAQQQQAAPQPGGAPQSPGASFAPAAAVGAGSPQ